ncbi:hypothetical protein K1W69_21755 [Hoeflea sp. WL0058]|uniref:Uncharacterized protein n=1 Tax=Flavimaribacter sediminis TaxID=2865987 RepID=A0AAE2ZS64_9HYPH|nr:hypothetical protein [Flavimaribacter sediminis]MBW8639835.1 hypothetical protein [Flavimaribacter sediminis]
MGLSAGLLTVAAACVIFSVFVVDTQSSATMRRSEEAALSKSSVFTLNWAPAFCKTDPENEGCSSGRLARLGDQLIIHGLWPQPYENDYCEVPEKEKLAAEHGHLDQLPPVDIAQPMFDRLLPHYSRKENLAYEWLKHGSCSGVGQDEYFEDIEDLFGQVSGVLEPLFRDAAGGMLKVETIQEKLDATLGHRAGSRFKLVCGKAHGISGDVIVEAELSLPRVEDLRRDGALKPLKDLLTHAPRIEAGCPEGLVVASES